MAARRARAPARVAAALLLLIVATIVEGGVGLTTDQHGCRRLCESALGPNDTEAFVSIAAI